MSAAEVAAVPAGRARRGPGAIAIVATMLVISALGAVGFWNASELRIRVAGMGPTIAAGAVWALYGAALILIIVLLQRFGRRPGWAVLLGLAWGGFACVYVAGTANTAVSTVADNVLGSSDWTVWISPPIVEESLKALGVILLVLIPVLWRIGPLDGLFLGAVVGAGFQVVENFSFTLAAFSTEPDAVQAIWVTLFLRGVLGVFSHVVYSGLIGAAIGWVVAAGPARRAGRVALAVLVGLAAMALHGWTNWAATADLLVPHMVVSAAGFVVLVLVIVRARISENARLTAWAQSDAAIVPDLYRETLAEHPRGRAGRLQRRLALAAVTEAEQEQLAPR